MEAVIDNKKMWESIFRNHPSEQDWINICDIKLALKDQGLQWNGKEIVSIEPEFKIEEGKWYMCLQDIYDACDIRFLKGKVYQSTSDGYIDNVSISNKNTIFRPATEEEIVQLADTTCGSPNDLNGLIKEHGKEFSSVGEMELEQKVFNEIFKKRDIDTYIAQVKNAIDSMPYSHHTFIWNVLTDLMDDLKQFKELKEKRYETE